MSTKTNKSFTKRLRVTKNGKVLARKAGFNHFNAKQSRSKQLAGKRPVRVINIRNKDIARFMPHVSKKKGTSVGPATKKKHDALAIKNKLSRKAA